MKASNLKSIFFTAFFIPFLLGEFPVQAQRVHARLNQSQKRIFELLISGRPDERKMAMVQCGLNESHFCTRRLMQYLQDEDPQYRYQAAEALGQIADPVSLNALSEALEKAGKDAREDKDIQGMQKEIQEDTLRPHETDVRRKKAYQFVLFEAKLVWAIGEIASPESVEKIKPHLQNESARVRRVAALGLGNIKNENAFSVLKSAYGSEKNDRVKAALAFSILKADVSDAKTSKELIALVFSPDGMARYDTADYIYTLRLKEARDSLLKALNSEEDEETRIRFFKAYQMSINRAIE